MSQQQKPQILQHRIAAESHLFTIESLQLRFSNGVERQFERVCGRAGGAVMILPLLDKDTFLLVREYGVGVEDYVLCFPKGAVGSDEDLLQTANRELMEEIGYGARKLTKLSQFSASPNYFSSMMQLILAEELYAKAAVGDEPEPLEVVPWRMDQIDELLQHPQFHEARSIAALLLFERQYRG